MKRRKLLGALGSVVATSTVAISTGAFSQVSADRSVTVNTEGDRDAYLGLKALVDEGIGGDATRRSASPGLSGTVFFQIPGEGPGESGAEGVGKDSIYKFDDLLRIVNQGTQPVEIHTKYEGDNLADLALVEAGTRLKDDPPTISAGDYVDVGLYVDTHGSTIDEFDETLTIVAEAPDE